MAATAAASIEVLPLGAGQRVGRSAILATHGGTTVLLDCGEDVGAASERDVLPDPRFFGARPPRCVLLTHAHVDHVGALPALLPKLPPGCEVLATEATRRAAALSLDDAASGPSAAEGRSAAVSAAIASIRSVRAGAPAVVAGGALRVTPVPVGHVIGACAWFVEFAAREPASAAAPRGSLPAWPDVAARSAALAGLSAPSGRWPGTSASLVYTGDLGPFDELALPGPGGLAALPRPDVLVCESTYGGVVRPPRAAEASALASEVLRAARAGGSAVVACHALGRAQEAVAIAATALASDPAAAARVRLVVGSAVLHDPTWPDEPRPGGPWEGPRVGATPLLAGLRARGAASVAPRRIAGRGLTAAVTYLYADVAPDAAPGFREALAALAASRAALPRAASPVGTVLVTAPLGLSGGPGAELLWRIAGDPSSAVVLTGRAPDGSPARAAQDGAPAVRLRPPRPAGAAAGEPVPSQLLRLRCHVSTCSLSAHADGDDVVRLCRAVAPRAGVVLVHAGGAGRGGKPSPERSAASSLRHQLQQALSVPVYDPPDHTAVAVALPLGLTTEPPSMAGEGAEGAGRADNASHAAACGQVLGGRDGSGPRRPGSGSSEADAAGGVFGAAIGAQATPLDRLAAAWAVDAADPEAAVRAVMAGMRRLTTAGARERAEAEAAGLDIDACREGVMLD